jgi:hypothetical protein
MYQILIYTRLLLLSVHVQEVSFVFICKEKCPGITITLPCSLSFDLTFFHLFFLITITQNRQTIVTCSKFTTTGKGERVPIRCLLVHQRYGCMR